MKTHNEMTTYPKPITIRLTDSLFKFVQKRAKNQQTKMSEAIRSLVRERMEEDAKRAAEEKK